MESSLRGHYQQQEQQSQNYAPPQRSELSSSLSTSQQRNNNSHQNHQQFHHNHHSHHQTNSMNEYASVGSYYSRGSHGSASQQSSQVDEAARRLGHRLSMRAHGDKSAPRPQRLSHLGMTPQSGFGPFGVTYKEQQNPQQQQKDGDIENDDSPNAIWRRGDDDAEDIDMKSQTTPAGGSSSLNLNRTKKVAKTKYSDHGDHHRHGDDKTKPQRAKVGSIVRKMTIGSADLFKLWQEEAKSAAGKGRKKRQSPTHDGKREDLSPQRFAFSQLALDTANATTATGQQQTLSPSIHKKKQQQQQTLTQQLQNLSSQQLQQQQRHKSNHHQQLLHQRHQHHAETSASSSSADHHSLFAATKDDKGHLTAVIENASLGSSKRTSLGNDSRSMKSMASANSSIATKESLLENAGEGGANKTNISNTMDMIQPPPPLPQGKCLTQPSVPTSNNELDNAEGNLIVHENDTISLTRKQIHVLTKDKMKHAKRADFRIMGLLGQGTFAQVFQCLHVQTDQMVAVKVVKNKPAYTRQAAVEIDVFRALVKKNDKNTNVSGSQSHKVSSSPSIQDDTGTTGTNFNNTKDTKWEHMVDLICYFMYKSHLCLVFEILGLNLYEVLKRRQFRGLPLSIVRTLLRQAVGGVKELAKKSIVHCDIKPENILLAKEDDTDSVVTAGESTNRRWNSQLGSLVGDGESREDPPADMSSGPSSSIPAIQGNLKQTLKKLNAPDKLSASSGNSLGTAGTVALTNSPGIKLIDFGSACFEGQTAHTYIQSRFYRSPEVLIGLPYDSAIDMWSLGCVAAELFLGLPILPGVHEHDQLSRVSEMIAKVPDWMLEQGSKSTKYFVKYMPSSSSTETTAIQKPAAQVASITSQSRKPIWRLQTQQEYIASLSPNDIRKKGGLAKLEKQPTNRYFKKKKLADIIMHKGLHGKPEDMESLELFVHFLYGILDPDPWRRWTAHQASHHPFISGGIIQRRSQGAPLGEGAKDQNQANSVGDIYWDPPWDPGICRRKLLNVQKIREKQHVTRRGGSSYRNHHGNIVQNRPSSASSEGSGGDRKYATKAADVGAHPSQHGLGAVSAAKQSGLGAQMQQNQFQMSTSYSDLPNNSQFVNNNDDASMGGMSNPHLYQSIGQSYTDASYGGTWHGSVEAEFAYALQRPGVIPMGGSVASFDLSVGQNSQHASVGGSYGGNRSIQNLGQHLPSNANTISSRSFGGNIADPISEASRVSLGGAAASLGQYPPSSLRQQHQQALPPGTSLGQDGGPSSLGPQLGGPAPTPSSLGQQVLQHGSYNLGIYGSGQQPSSIPQSIDPANVSMAQAGLLQDSLLGADPAFAQAYLQQQHAALQQQQALLQQQQAALALQQEQLRSYGVNPGLFNSNNLATVGSSVNQFGQQAPQQLVGQQPQQMIAQQSEQGSNNGGYYYVTAADGTPMLVSNQVMPQQQQGQAGVPSSPYGIPQNYQNYDSRRY